MEQKPTKIDAVAMVRRIRDAHHEALKDATREERIAFFNDKVRRDQAAALPRPRESTT